MEWPTAVHESHSKLSDCFRPILDEKSEYITPTNLHIRLQHGPFRGQQYIPDYGIGRQLGGRMVWELFWECGMSQSSNSLREKVLKWFSGHGDLKAVITLDIQSSTFHGPETPAPLPVTEATFRNHIDSNCDYFGPMVWEDWVWAPKVDKIVLTIFLSPRKSMSWVRLSITHHANLDSTLPIGRHPKF